MCGAPKSGADRNICVREKKISCKEILIPVSDWRLRKAWEFGTISGLRANVPADTYTQIPESSLARPFETGVHAKNSNLTAKRRVFQRKKEIG
jgi:hypothetical protein